ncbi:hypothetical protein VNO80_05707 [Phaseolus coccineus]|uniref:PGG domain-containing protein n=1 Tax=Phaseolus coccineus TaxID=3886 RepID=A0AAN9NFJ6_PHACN
MMEASKYGNTHFIYIMSEANHDLLRAVDKYGRDMFSYAVLHRKENVLQLMFFLTGYRNLIHYSTDKFGNNLLHLAAYLGPSSYLNNRAGAALQMQREVQWFKAVEEIVAPSCRKAKNDEGKIPIQIFIETHKELMKEGEKWIKDTAGTLAIVGILVISVIFAALFTVPGGYHEKTGLPIYLNQRDFIAFIVFDVLSILTSIMAILFYIDIHMSRFARNDFLHRLPQKIRSGLLLLSMSLLFMVTAFNSALAVILQYSKVRLGLVLDVLPTFRKMLWDD